MAKFKFSDVETWGDAISSEELKKIAIKVGDYKCLCDMMMATKPFLTAPVPDAVDATDCYVKCKTMCGKNKYCRSVSYCFDEKKMCDRGSGSWYEIGSGSDSDSGSGSGSGSEDETIPDYA